MYQVLHALKRLKGPAVNKKDKMPEQIKRTFDQLTEDAMKLMEGGEYGLVLFFLGVFLTFSVV